MRCIFPYWNCIRFCYYVVFKYVFVFKSHYYGLNPVPLQIKTTILYFFLDKESYGPKSWIAY